MRFQEVPVLLPGMRAWCAIAGDYHFVISHEDGTRLRPEDRAEWTGYTASWKSYDGRNAQAVRIDGLWQSFTAAEKACRDTWRQLRQKN